MKKILGVTLVMAGVAAMGIGCKGNSGNGGGGATATGSTTSTGSKMSTTGATMTTGSTTTTSGGMTGSTTSTGGGAPTCQQYCTAIMMNCTGANQQFMGNMTTCMTACMTVTKPGTTADSSGNTIGCHLYHANAAAGSPDPHCWHAAVPSLNGPNTTMAGPCVDAAGG